MRAYAIVEPRPDAARLVDVADPVVGPGDVLIRNRAVGICGTVDAVTAPDAAAARRVLDGVSDGYGADVAFETAGHPVAVQTAIHLARKGGRIGVVGLPHDPSLIDTAQLVWSEKTIVAVRGYNERCWVRGQELMASGSIDLLPLVTHRLPLARSDEAFDLVRRREALKVIVQP